MWHAERNYQINVLGKDPEAAKKAASAKASKRTMELAAAKEAGTLPPHVIV